MKLPMVPKTTPECKLTIMNAGFCTTKKSHLIKGAVLELIYMMSQHILLDETFCTTKKSHLIKDDDSLDISVPALFLLIEHPVHSNILFDTGYSTRYFKVTKKFPFSLMNKVTPVQITERENAINQLLEMNITANDIKTV